MLLSQDRTGLYRRETQPAKAALNTDAALRLDAPFFPGSSTRSRYYVDQSQWFNFTWRAYTPTKAFLLNAAIVALSVATGTELRRISALETGILGWLVCASITFGVAFLVHELFFACFLFGSGMVASRSPVYVAASDVQLGKPDAYKIDYNNVHIGPSAHPTVSAIYFGLKGEAPSGFSL